jgi:hypothetical protein
MHQPGGMRRLQAAARLRIQIHDLAPGKRTRTHELGERLAVDELHRHEDAAAEGGDVVHRDDVGVLETRHRLRLAQQPGAAVASAVVAQQLDRHLAVELGVVGGVDHAHAALAEAVEDQVAPEAGAALEGLGRNA